MNNKFFPRKTHFVGFILGAVFLATLTGCVGWVDGSGAYSGPAVVAAPDVYLFGGDYDRRDDAHAYSNRGAVSRGVAHPGGYEGRH